MLIIVLQLKGAKPLACDAIFLIIGSKTSSGKSKIALLTFSESKLISGVFKSAMHGVVFKILQLLSHCDDGSKISADGFSVYVSRLIAGVFKSAMHGATFKILQLLLHCDDGSKISADGFNVYVSRLIPGIFESAIHGVVLKILQLLSHCDSGTKFSADGFSLYASCSKYCFAPASTGI